jgi:mRNA-degrading endonuclease toxin of MazEF toxin-antitoxin module
LLASKSNHQTISTGDVIKISLAPQPLNAEKDGCEVHTYDPEDPDKTRPCIVVATPFDHALYEGSKLSTIIVVPVTSSTNSFDTKNPWVLRIPKEGSCFDYDSYALIHQVRAVDIRRIRKGTYMGSIDSGFSAMISIELKEKLGKMMDIVGA